MEQNYHSRKTVDYDNLGNMPSMVVGSSAACAWLQKKLAKSRISRYQLIFSWPWLDCSDTLHLSQLSGDSHDFR